MAAGAPAPLPPAPLPARVVGGTGGPNDAGAPPTDAKVAVSQGCQPISPGILLLNSTAIRAFCKVTTFLSDFVASKGDGKYQAQPTGLISTSKLQIEQGALGTFDARTAKAPPPIASDAFPALQQQQDRASQTRGKVNATASNPTQKGSLEYTNLLAAEAKLNAAVTKVVSVAAKPAALSSATRQYHQVEKDAAIAFVSWKTATARDNETIAWVESDSNSMNLHYVDKDGTENSIKISNTEVSKLVRQYGAHVQVFKPDDFPTSGYLRYCRDYPKQCNQTDLVERVIINGPRKIDASLRFWELVAINKRVNREIKYTSDIEQHGHSEIWTYGENGEGDCEDQALRKKQLCLKNGFPPEALMLTHVTVEGEGHMLLMVRTTEGDLYMDNGGDRLYTQKELENKRGYVFIARQADDGSDRWVNLNKKKSL